MAYLLKIPLDESVPWYAFTISLDSATYTLEAYYNTRAERWRLNILDATETPLLTGLPLLIDRDLTAPYLHLSIPPGQFTVLDDTGAQAQPTLSSFLLDHSLYYLEA